MDERTVWCINTWIGENVVWLLWCFFTIAVALQQFPTTEPLAFGALWIPTICLFVGGAVTQGNNCSFRMLCLNLAIQLFGIVLQIALAVYCWQELATIDRVLRDFRSLLVSRVPGGDHLLPMRVLWLAWTAAMLWSAWQRGRVFHRVGQRLW